MLPVGTGPKVSGTHLHGSASSSSSPRSKSGRAGSSFSSRECSRCERGWAIARMLEKASQTALGANRTAATSSVLTAIVSNAPDPLWSLVTLARGGLHGLSIS